MIKYMFRVRNYLFKNKDLTKRLKVMLKLLDIMLNSFVQYIYIYIYRDMRKVMDERGYAKGCLGIKVR